jgi:DNA-binding MarR family transcriptional regulator
MAHSWGFLTNHALVLIYIVRHPDSTVHEIATGVGITDRATLAILRELDTEGIIIRARAGRRNTYDVEFERLAAYRRHGTVALTPREFVDGLVGTLLRIARNGDAPADDDPAPEDLLDSGALEPRLGRWGFFTNHALLLLSIALDRHSTVREMAASIGVTERAIVAILNQLEMEGIVLRRRLGRRNEYEIDFVALRQFRRWSPGAWRLPPELIDVAVKGLYTLHSNDAAPTT